MKALTLLQDYYHDIIYFTDKNNIDEAIAELEALQQPKDCGKCKHIHQGWWCNENGIKVTLDFCCNRYEPKEQ